MSAKSSTPGEEVSEVQEELEQVCFRSPSLSRQLGPLGYWGNNRIASSRVPAKRSARLHKHCIRQRSDRLPSLNKEMTKQIYPGFCSLRDNGCSGTSCTSKTSSPMCSCVRSGAPET